MKEYMWQIDIKITSGLVQFWTRSMTLNVFMKVVAQWTPIVMLLLVILASSGAMLSLEYQHQALLGALSAIISAFIGRGVNEAVARWINRERPFQKLLFQPLLAHEKGASFPSNHATGALALAIGCIHIPGYFLLLIILALILCLSRIYCGLHYFTDVIFGAFEGMIVAELVLFYSSVMMSIRF